MRGEAEEGTIERKGKTKQWNVKNNVSHVNSNLRGLFGSTNILQWKSQPLNWPTIRKLRWCYWQYTWDSPIMYIYCVSECVCVGDEEHFDWSEIRVHFDIIYNSIPLWYMYPLSLSSSFTSNSTSSSAHSSYILILSCTCSHASCYSHFTYS